MSYRNTAIAKRHWSLSVIMLGGSYEAQTWKSGRPTVAVPLCRLPFLRIWEGSKGTEGSCCFFQHTRGISESYHHMLLVLLFSLFLRKPEGKAGSQQDKHSKLTCLLSPLLTLEEFLPWVAGRHSCPKQAATYTDTHSAFGLLGYLVPSRERFCWDAIIMHLPKPLLLSSRIW